MREIIFRGKRVDSGEWAYGVGPLEVCPGKWATMYTPKELCYVNPETIGQYTGLTDKNGVKIYEGDIVEGLRYRDYGTFGEYETCQFSVTWDEGKARFSPFNLFDGYTYDFKTFRVIGNIHDNPELLEGGGVYDQRRSD